MKLGKGNLGSLKVRIKTAMDVTEFPLAKLRPGRNNLRSAIAKAGEGPEEVALLPTPQYNNSILEVTLNPPVWGCCRVHACTW